LIYVIDDALEEYLTEDPGGPVVMVLCSGDVR
jgi:hypothetical protein